MPHQGLCDLYSTVPPFATQCIWWREFGGNFDYRWFSPCVDPRTYIQSKIIPLGYCNRTQPYPAAFPYLGKPIIKIITRNIPNGGIWFLWLVASNLMHLPPESHDNLSSLNQNQPLSFFIHLSFSLHDFCLDRPPFKIICVCIQVDLESLKVQGASVLTGIFFLLTPYP